MTRCETCGGEGTVIEFRRFAGEYQAGEPVEVCCPDCDGAGEFDDDTPVREPYVPSREYLAWCEKIDRDPLKHLEPMAKPDAQTPSP